MGAHKGMGGGQGVTLKNGEWSPGTKNYRAVLAGIQQKPHRKHLANCMSPHTHLPLILMMLGSSQGQIPPFKPVIALRKDVC